MNVAYRSSFVLCRQFVARRKAIHSDRERSCEVQGVNVRVVKLRPGVGLFDPPVWFFIDCAKTVARSAGVFLCIAVRTTIPQLS